MTKMNQSHYSFDNCSCGIPDFPSTLKEQAKMALEMREQGIKDGEYRFEHDARPQLLNETE